MALCHLWGLAFFLRILIVKDWEHQMGSLAQRSGSIPIINIWLVSELDAITDGQGVMEKE